MTFPRLGLALLLASPFAAGCDSGDADLSSAKAFLRTPTDGDTLYVSDRRMPGEPLLIWTASLPIGTGRHFASVQIATDPSFSFDPDFPQPANFARKLSQYDRPQPAYLQSVPRPVTSGGERTDEPTRFYWRTRISGLSGEPGAWSETGTFVVVAELPQDG